MGPSSNLNAQKTVLINSDADTIGKTTVKNSETASVQGDGNCSTTHDNKQSKKIKVMYTNADVLTNKIDLLAARIKAELPQIIGINEVKPKYQRFKVLPAEFNMEELGFDMFVNNIEEEQGKVSSCMCQKI